MSFDSYRESRDLYGCHKRCFWEINSNLGACLLNNEKGGYQLCNVWPKVKILGMDQNLEKDMP